MRARLSPKEIDTALIYNEAPKFKEDDHMPLQELYYPCKGEVFFQSCFYISDSVPPKPVTDGSVQI